MDIKDHWWKKDRINECINWVYVAILSSVATYFFLSPPHPSSPLLTPSSLISTHPFFSFSSHCPFSQELTFSSSTSPPKPTTTSWRSETALWRPALWSGDSADRMCLPPSLRPPTKPQSISIATTLRTNQASGSSTRVRSTYRKQEVTQAWHFTSQLASFAS